MEDELTCDSGVWLLQRKEVRDDVLSKTLPGPCVIHIASNASMALEPSVAFEFIVDLTRKEMNKYYKKIIPVLRKLSKKFDFVPFAVAHVSIEDQPTNSLFLDCLPSEVTDESFRTIALCSCSSHPCVRRAFLKYLSRVNQEALNDATIKMSRKVIELFLNDQDETVVSKWIGAAIAFLKESPIISNLIMKVIGMESPLIRVSIAMRFDEVYKITEKAIKLCESQDKHVIYILVRQCSKIDGFPTKIIDGWVRMDDQILDVMILEQFKVVPDHTIEYMLKLDDSTVKLAVIKHISRNNISSRFIKSIMSVVPDHWVIRSEILSLPTEVLFMEESSVIELADECKDSQVNILKERARSVLCVMSSDKLL